MRKMILELRGGLGNQLFQYQLAQHIAKKNGLEFTISPQFTDESYNFKKYDDRTGLTKSGFYHYEKIIKIQSKPDYFNILENKKRVLRRKCGIEISDPPNQNYTGFLNQNFSKVRYINGFFQTSLFLNHNQLQEDYNRYVTGKQIRYQVSNYRTHKNSYLNYKFNMNSTRDKLAIHIRGSDYLKMGNTLGNLNYQYFLNALAIFNLKDISAIIIFTDDISWAKKIMLAVEEKYHRLKAIKLYIYKSAGNDLDSFYLLSSFENIIISNSTFSWWASYFNRIDKLVIAPTKWYRNSPYCPSLIENGFHLIKSVWI